MIINESETAWEFGQFVGERGIGHRNYNTKFRCAVRRQLQLMVRIPYAERVSQPHTGIPISSDNPIIKLFSQPCNSDFYKFTQDLFYRSRSPGV